MGSKFGWIIAGAVVLAIGGIATYIFVFPSPTDPTGATQKFGFMEVKPIDTPISDVIGYQPRAEGNAADDYQKAIAVYKKNAKAIGLAWLHSDELGRGAYALDAGLLKALQTIDDLVAPGTLKASMKYTFVYTPKEFVVGLGGATRNDMEDFSTDPTIYAPASQMYRLGTSLELLAYHYYGKKDYAKAEKTLKHVFVVGRHMMDEDSRPVMVQSGIDLQSDAIDLLRAVYRGMGGDHSKQTKAMSAYNSCLKAILDHYEAKTAALWKAVPNPGDAFNMAENEKDRAWRVQAILYLGLLNYAIKIDQISRGDARMTTKLIEKYINSSDEFEAAAAKAARDITEAEFKKIGNR